MKVSYGMGIVACCGRMGRGADYWEKEDDGTSRRGEKVNTCNRSPKPKPTLGRRRQVQWQWQWQSGDRLCCEAGATQTTMGAKSGSSRYLTVPSRRIYR